jgi:acetyl-CoA carboxylase carboxyltransferase component
MQPTDTPALSLRDLTAEIRAEESRIRLGGGEKAIERQHAKRRLTARERISLLIDDGSQFLELGTWAGWKMYDEYGGAPAAGLVVVVGLVSGRRHMIIANDATVKAGAFFPATTKKLLRAQRIAMANRVPIIYLVDSSGVFLPLQEDIFPDDDDFGRIFRNNAVFSAAGLEQTAAVMGNCVAGGGYLPVLCDKLLMTEGSGLYLAGPALVKSAIGQVVSHEQLGGAEMHAQVSGTIDYREPSDEACITRLRSLAALRAPDGDATLPFHRSAASDPARPTDDVHEVVDSTTSSEYDVRDLLACITDRGSVDEYKAEYGGTVVCATARIGGFSVGIVANQHRQVRPADGPIQFPGVLYVDSAEKAARFVMNCNQDWLPLVFLQNVNGFMVGRDSEQSGIIKAGAKLVNAMANSRVPKLTVVTGGSFGAGNYAMCGKAYDPRFIFGWPSARCAVMGGEQATSTLLDVMVRSLERRGEQLKPDELAALRERIRRDYDEQMDVRYGAARGWFDAIIAPADTRSVLIAALEIATRHADDQPYRTGVFQV